MREYDVLRARRMNFFVAFWMLVAEVERGSGAESAELDDALDERRRRRGSGGSDESAEPSGSCGERNLGQFTFTL